MIKASVAEIKTYFERYLRQSKERGEEILILRHGKPHAIIRPLGENDMEGKDGLDILIEQKVQAAVNQYLQKSRKKPG